MGHHVHALPPPIIPLAPKTEKPRWRPRVRSPAQQPDETGVAQAASEGETVFAAGGPLDEQPGRHPGPRHGKAAPHAAQRSGLAAQALTDETLRTLLIGQETIRGGAD